MNNGNKRRSRRRYRIRYDRIIMVALVFIVLIFIITSCAKGCSDKKDNENSQNSVVDQLEPGNSVSGADNQGGTNASGATGGDVQNTGSVEYTTQSVEYSEVYNGDLVLVNSLYQYKFQEGDINPVTLYDHRENCYSVSDYVITLDSDTITQLNAFMNGFYTAQANTDISVIGGYRTLEKQNEKYQNGTSKFQGGYSDYNTGRTIDIGIFPQSGSSNYYAPDGIYSWIDEHAADYGFILRFPDGKETLTGESGRTYTYRYVGVPHAAYIKENNLCLEEYIEQIKNYTSTSPLSITSGTSQYSVYYVPANMNSATEVPVPSNRTYTISGNNVDGFIVAVTMS